MLLGLGAVGVEVNPPTVAALALGTLAARLGPARVRLHTDAGMALALADVVTRVQAMVADLDS